MTKIKPNLAGIPETMLWTLYARAGEAKRPNGFLKDPLALKIFELIDYDYERNFGPPNALFARRATLIDKALKAWLKRHPEGLVVSLGEGLETQAQRVDNGKMRWLSVDLPQAIEVREYFIKANERFQHLSADATQTSWTDQIDPRSAPFVVAQGLFMYLEPEAVKNIFVSIGRRFPGSQLLFDVVPRELSQRTLAGHQETPDYKLPPMPWGLNREEIIPTLKGWHSGIKKIEFHPYNPSKKAIFIDPILDRLGIWKRDYPANLVQVYF